MCYHTNNVHSRWQWEYQSESSFPAHPRHSARLPSWCLPEPSLQTMGNKGPHVYVYLYLYHSVSVYLFSASPNIPKSPFSVILSAKRLNKFAETTGMDALHRLSGHRNADDWGMAQLVVYQHHLNMFFSMGNLKHRRWKWDFIYIYRHIWHTSWNIMECT